MLCLPRGLEIIQGQGVNLRGSFPLPLNVVSDSAQRDINTSLSLIAGLGYSGVPLTVDANIFNPAGRQTTYELCSPTSHDHVGSICPNPSTDFLNAGLLQRWNTVPYPSNFTELQTYMQSLLGQGIAPPVQNIHDSVFDGNFNGGTNIAGNFAEFFEMQFGGGIPLSFNVTEDDMYAFLELLTFYRSIYARSLPIVQYTESNLLAHVLQALSTAKALLSSYH